MYPVLELASFLQLLFLVLLHCLCTCPFEGSFSLRWQFTSGAVWWWHCSHLPPKPKECPLQLASRATLLSPLPIDLRHTGVSCLLSNLTLNECCNMKSVAHHNALLVNLKLGKISEWLEQYRASSSAPVWTWKWIHAAQLSSLLSRQPNLEVETLSQVKVHRASAPTDNLCSSVSSLPGYAFHYKAKTNNQSHYLFKAITGHCRTKAAKCASKYF